MKLKEFVRNPYNYDPNQLSDETGLACTDPSLTQQQFAQETDINYIANRFGLTGELPHVLQLPQYGDYSGIFDFQTAQNAVIAAQQQFLTLPAKIRSRFDNSPQKLLEFLADPENRAEADFLGLTAKQEPTDASRPASAPSETTQERPRTHRASPDKGASADPQKPGPKDDQADRR